MQMEAAYARRERGGVAECTEEADDETDARRGIALSISEGSFLIICGGIFAALGEPFTFGCFRVLLPARSSSKRNGRGRK